MRISAILLTLLLPQLSFANEAAEPKILTKSIIEHAYPLIPIALSIGLIDCRFSSPDGKVQKLARYLMLTGALAAVTEVAQIATEFGFPSTVAGCAAAVVMFVPKHYIDSRIDSNELQTTFRQIMALLTGGLLTTTGVLSKGSAIDSLPALYAVTNVEKGGSVATGLLGSEVAKKILAANQYNELAGNLEAARGETTWLATMFILRDHLVEHFMSKGFSERNANVQAGVLLIGVGSLIRYMATNSDFGFAGEVIAMSGMYSLLDAFHVDVRNFFCWLPGICWTRDIGQWLYILPELALAVLCSISRPINPVVANLPQFLYVMQRSLAKTLLVRVAIHVSTVLAPQLMASLNRYLLYDDDLTE